MLRRLLGDIDREHGSTGGSTGSTDIAARIYDDASTSFVEVQAVVKTYPWAMLIPRPVHGGKRLFFDQMNRVLRDARRSKDWTRLLILPDDVRLAPDFFARLEAAWAAIPSHAKLLINPLMDARGPLAHWTRIDPAFVDRGPGLYRVGWNDGCLYSGRRLVERFVRFRCPSPIRWRRSYISTSVGEQLSRWACQHGFTLWQVADSLLYHGDHPSQMHAKP